jgi:hypothetical protein
VLIEDCWFLDCRLSGVEHSAGVNQMNLSSASISLGLATFRSQAMNSLFNSADTASEDALWASLTRQPVVEKGAVSASFNGISPAGRNLALFDPESAYKMMSVINHNDVSYKAQFSELSQMKSDISQMEAEGLALGQLSSSSSNGEMATRLQQFVGQYNAWVERFDPDLQSGGLLADTQAAQVARYELDQSIENGFNGAADGVHGLADLGVVINPNTHLATLDIARLDSLLTSNRQGAVNTLHQFSANFAKSASLLNSEGNFMPNQLNNLSKVIDYFADHKTALQNEFGSGDTARPNAQVAQALAAYKAA